MTIVVDWDIKNETKQKSGSALFAFGNMIRYDPTLVEWTSNYHVLCTSLIVYFY